MARKEMRKKGKKIVLATRLKEVVWWYLNEEHADIV